MNAPGLDWTLMEGTLTEGILAEAGPGLAGAKATGGLALALCLSLVLHLAAAAAVLGFSQVRAGGEPGGGSGPLVLTVDLTAWAGPGGQGGGGGLEAEAEELAEAAEPEAVTEKPGPVLADLPPPDPVLPDPEAFSLKAVKPDKAKPRPLKAIDQPRVPAPKDEGRSAGAAGTAGPMGTAGPAESAGSAGAGASAPGGGGAAGNLAGYLKGNYEYIKKRIRQHLVYHPQAKRLGIQGTVTVSFIIGADGRARNTAVSKTSGSNMLDESALKAVHKASPFPPPPKEARIVVPISFSLK